MTCRFNPSKPNPIRAAMRGVYILLSNFSSSNIEKLHINTPARIKIKESPQKREKDNPNTVGNRTLIPVTINSADAILANNLDNSKSFINLSILSNFYLLYQ